MRWRWRALRAWRKLAGLFVLSADDRHRLRMAEIIARSAHAGQVDKLGEPYLWHVQRVEARIPLRHVNARIVGLLHDTVEDNPLITLEFIESYFGADIAEGVDAMTHRKGEPRSDYYRRVRANPLAAEDKDADLDDNTDSRRMSRLPTEVRDRLITKYSQARQELNQS